MVSLWLSAITVAFLLSNLKPRARIVHEKQWRHSIRRSGVAAARDLLEDVQKDRTIGGYSVRGREEEDGSSPRKTKTPPTMVGEKNFLPFSWH